MSAGGREDKRLLPEEDGARIGHVLGRCTGARRVRAQGEKEGATKGRHKRALSGGRKGGEALKTAVGEADKLPSRASRGMQKKACELVRRITLLEVSPCAHVTYEAAPFVVRCDGF